MPVEELEIEDDSEDGSNGKKTKVTPIHIIDAYYIVIKERSVDVYIKKDDKFGNPWHYIEPEFAFKAIRRDMMKKGMQNHSMMNKSETIQGLTHMLNVFNEKLLVEVMNAFEPEEFKSAITSRNINRLKAELKRLEEIEELHNKKNKEKPKSSVSDAEFIGMKEEPEIIDDEDSE